MAAGRVTGRALAAAVLLVTILAGVTATRMATGAAQPATECSGRAWVTAWLAAPQDAGGRFDDQTIRSIATVSASGTSVRVTLSNRFGDEAVTFDDVHVAVRRSGAAVDGDTVRPVRFDGARSVRIPAGGEAVSDGVALDVVAGDELAVSYHVDGPAALDRHVQALQTSYVTPSGAGRHGADVDGGAFTEPVESWFGLVAVDVEAPRSTGAVAVLGDSLTEGVGSTPDAGRRWPDVVAGRLGGRAAVLNAGIGGNHAARAFAMPTESGPVSFGPGAADRLDADVLRRSGVTDLVVYVGINDVFTAQGDDVVDDVTHAYRRIVREAHGAGLRVIGATLTPASQGGAKEADRQAINEWIRTSGVFDAVVDFDRAVADHDDPSRLRPEFDADRVHLTDAGYAALAGAFDESLLQGTGCPA